MAQGYYIGIDGGGTKTTAKLGFVAGGAPVVLRGGGINLCSIPKPKVEATLLRLLKQAADAAGGEAPCLGICAGVAGFSQPGTKGAIGQIIQKSGLTQNITVTSDAHIALSGALGGGAGAILISGTGSVCYGAGATGQSAICGGYGHLLEDGGSGFAIGQGILNAVLHALEGRGPGTALTALVAEGHGLAGRAAIIDYVYGGGKGSPKARVAALAPLLSRACEADDRPALEIANTAAACLLQLAGTVLDTLALQKESMALMGSILEKESFVRGPLIEQLTAQYPHLSLVPPKGDAADGALLQAGLGGG